MTGFKQFSLEFLNFVFNTVIFFCIFLILNFISIEFFECTKLKLLIMNYSIGFLFIAYCFVQNICFRSLFYKIVKIRITSLNKYSKLKILSNNILFNSLLLGTILLSVFEVRYSIKVIVIVLLLVDFITCFTKMNKSLICFLCEIESAKY